MIEFMSLYPLCQQADGPVQYEVERINGLHSTQYVFIYILMAQFVVIDTTQVFKCFFSSGSIRLFKCLIQVSVQQNEKLHTVLTSL